MPCRPACFAGVILAFAPLFVHCSWRHAQVLLIGTLLAPGRRTVTGVSRITGRSRERHFVDYHRVDTSCLLERGYRRRADGIPYASGVSEPVSRRGSRPPPRSSS